MSILTFRTSPQAWLDSANASIGKVFDEGPPYYLTYLVPEMHFGFLLNNLWDRQTRERNRVGVWTTKFYSLHIQHIRGIVPKDRLPECKAVDRWETQCEFPGTAVPEQKYPHRNDSKAAS
jgi:hypothetical protein